MTATAPLTRIPTPYDIATNPIYTCGTWRDPSTGANLPEFLAAAVGRVEARRILDDADDIATGARAVPRPPKQPGPRPGVDHDPIPLRQVTVCGLLIPPPFVYEPAGATPCPDCYEGATP